MLPPRLARRVLVPVLIAVEVALLLLFAATTVVGLLLAPFSRPHRVLRVGTMGVSYLGIELGALAALSLAWVIRRARPPLWWDDVNRRILAWALDQMLRAARRCLGFVVALDEPPHTSPLGEAAPVLVLARHGGGGDSVALVWLLLRRYDRRVRVVLKASLQWEPLLDVALNRLGACFLPKRAAPGEELASRLGRLATDLGPHDALLLFPEGGNWTPGRHARAIQRLRSERKHRAAKAASLMEHVLPPRPAGVFACVDARDDLAIVVFAHTGLDTLTTVAQTWKAIPFRQPMAVRWWPAPSPPSDPDGRLQWLTTEWAVVDEWIDARKPAAACSSAPDRIV